MHDSVISWTFHLFSPLLLGIFFAMFLNIPLHFFEKKVLSKNFFPLSFRQKRILAIIFSLIFICGLLGFFLFLVIPKFCDAFVTLTGIIHDNFSLSSAKESNFAFLLRPFKSYLKDLKFVAELPLMVRSSLSALFDIFLGIIFSIYLLSRKESFKQKTKTFLEVWVPKSYLPTIFHIVLVCSKTFQNFIVGQSLEALILGSLCAVGMFLLHLPYAGTIGVLVGVTAFLPFIGAYIGAAIGCILISTSGTFQVMVFLIFLISLQQLEGNIIYPKVVGKKINLPPILVLFSLTFGGRLAGSLGMLFGVPVFSVLYCLLKEVTEYKKRNLPH